MLLLLWRYQFGNLLQLSIDLVDLLNCPYLPALSTFFAFSLAFFDIHCLISAVLALLALTITAAFGARVETFTIFFQTV